MMRIGLLGAVLVLSLVGCAQPGDQAFRYEPAPVCVNDRQCAAMWSEATRQVEIRSGMKIRLLTDSYIETFDGSSQHRFLGKVRKRPSSTGQGYIIEGSFYCQFCSGADKVEADFNRNVTAAGAAFAPPRPPAAVNGQSQPVSRKAEPTKDAPQKQQEQVRTRTLYLQCVQGQAAQAANQDAALQACAPQLKTHRAAAFAAIQAFQQQDPFAGAQAAEDDALKSARELLAKP